MGTNRPSPSPFLRRRHLRAQTALLGTTCMLVRGDSNPQPSGWSVAPLPLHQHITGLYVDTITHFALISTMNDLHISLHYLYVDTIR